MKKIIYILVFVFLVGGCAYGAFWFAKNKNSAVTTPAVSIDGGAISAVIVPHFDDFSKERAELLKNVGNIYKPEKVVVVSVNHFNSGSSNILTADRTWKLGSGDFKSDSGLVKKLADSKIAGNDESAFTNEHGITNVLPDVIQNISPDFLPIIIKDTTTKPELDKLADWINQNCKDCMLVSSVDFSHYQPRALAKVHDSYSIQALTSIDFDKTWTAETDSPQTLYLTEKIAETNNTKNFHLFYNGNSGDLNNNDDMETTSVVLGYYSNAGLIDKEKIEPSTSFVIAGDAMFDRNVWQKFSSTGLTHVFDNFGDRAFRGVDLSLLNLEGPVSSVPVPGIQTGGMSFNFQPQVPSVLKSINVSAVSLANNHTNNAGTSGFTSTKTMLEKSGIKYFGTPQGFDNSASILHVDGPVPLSIIGIMTLESFDETALETKIKSEKSAGRTVIIFPHWGTEYQDTHSASQLSMAKSWTEAGADLVVGSHPHVVEDFGIVNKKPVLYSLGNFVFDQFFSADTQQGLIIAGTVTKDKITLTFLPTVEKSIKPQFMTGSAKASKIGGIIDLNSNTGFTKLSGDTIELHRN